MKAFLSFCACVIIGVNAGLPDAPTIDNRARVKQHRSGAQGELVVGEEDKRKIIVYWKKNFAAKNYEVCHGCRIADATGERDMEGGDSPGKVIEVGIDQTCSDNICLVVKGTNRGMNRFNVRVETSEGWSKWSKHANFDVQEAGFPTHVHHEL
mmetsp:Transcript_21247/g.32275  ORF Transcript_21247/g.32275 Transcript_21247/m.32275 type:complete len:153 (-) Transcript_21247:39-497(-)